MANCASRARNLSAVVGRGGDEVSTHNPTRIFTHASRAAEEEIGGLCYTYIEGHARVWNKIFAL